MAIKMISQSTRLMEQILLKESQAGGLTVSSKLALTDIPNYSPIQVLGEPHRFKFQTCVSQTEMDALCLSIRSCPGNATSDLSWPVVVKWKVSVINENTEESLDLETISSTFTKPTLETSSSHFSQNVQVHMSRVKNYIVDNSIILHWIVQLVSHNETCPAQQELSKPCDETQMREHIAAVVGLAQNIGARVNSDRCRENISQLEQALSISTTDEAKMATLDSRISNAGSRVNTLLDNFNEESKKVIDFMSSWKDVVDYVHAFSKSNDENPGMVDTDDSTAAHNISTSGENTGSVTTRRLRLLLIGESEAGKSATGNSILFGRAFQTGNTLLNQPRLKQATIVLSHVCFALTMVEASEAYLLKNKPTPFELCPEGFDAILCVDNYQRIKSYSGTVCHCLTHTFLDDEAIRSYVISVITGGDSFAIDHPNTTIQEFLRSIASGYDRLEDSLEERVLLFNNTTTSEERRMLQVTQLLQLVDSLPKGQERFTEDRFLESETKTLKSRVKNLHILRDGGQLRGIQEQLSTLTPFQHSQEWQTIMNSINTVNLRIAVGNYPPYHRDIDVEDVFKILIFGKPSNSVDTVMHQIEHAGISCQYRHLDLVTNLEEISYFTAILMVVSCAQLSPEDNIILKKVIKRFEHAIGQKGILIPVDGGAVNLRDGHLELENWCEEENDVIKDMLQACAGRAVLYDYETRDVVVRLQQEANLVKLLHSLLPKATIQPDIVPKGRPMAPNVKTFFGKDPNVTLEKIKYLLDTY